MNNEELIDVKTLRPFRRFIYTIGELPSSYLMSMTYEEQLIWLCNYLSQTVIPALNNNGLAVEELQAKYIELKDYVDHYFDNLDVQEEINNKLDDMAEHGELADIIAQYLGLAGVLAFNTVAEMVAGENLVNGSICKTLGKLSYNDGLGSFYKIRTITSGDVVDGENIIALDVSNTLIAEKIFNLDLETLKTEMSLINNKKVIVLGDSYANRTNSWADRFKSYLGFTDSNCIIKAVSGVGFYNTVDSKNFSTMVVDNIPFTGNEVTDIIVCGGYNDYGVSDENLENAFDDFIEICKTTYPNAHIYVGMIGWAKPGITNWGTIIGGLAHTRLRYDKYCGKYRNVHYLNGVEYSLHLISLLDETYFHPTSDGQEELALNIIKAWQTGYTDVHSEQVNITSSFTKESYITQIDSNIYSAIDNGTSRIFAGSDISFTFDQITSINLSSSIKLGTISNGYAQGRGSDITGCAVSALINTSNNGYFNIPAVIYINDNELWLKAKTLNRNGNGWITDSIKYIVVAGINIKVDSMTQY